MSFSRRDFVKVGGFAAAAAFFSNSVLGQEKTFFSGELSADPLSALNAKAFNQQLGSEFSLLAGDLTTTGVLAAVDNLPVCVDSSAPKTLRSVRKKNKAECFSLSFRLSISDVPQATYAVAHSQLGQFDLLMVPGRDAAGRQLLTAIINRL